MAKVLPDNAPVFSAGTNPAHGLPLELPLPVPEYVQIERGNPSPDRAVTDDEWPPGFSGD